MITGAQLAEEARAFRAQCKETQMGPIREGSKLRLLDVDGYYVYTVRGIEDNDGDTATLHVVQTEGEAQDANAEGERLADDLDQRFAGRPGDRQR